MTHYIVEIIETSTGLKSFNTEEEARDWMESPEENYEDIIWTDSVIEEMKLKEEI